MSTGAMPPVTLTAPNPGNDDVRHIVLGMIDGRHWTAITAKRGKRIRIIPVHRSRKNEEAYHESQKNDAKAITSDQLEEMLDNGEDILSYVDLGNPVVERHPPLEKRITLTMPAWMVSELDEEAAELAISRNAVVNTWIADRLRTMQRRENAHA